jgi:mono/diheme cytochrome c family protein
VMCNVSERVVRTAPCPVLTVREPRPDATSEKKPSTTIAATVLIAAMLLLPIGATTASAQTPPVIRQSIAGAELFRTYCASCHGTTARGDGVLASSMTRKPSDLTEIAKRNGGLFPTELVFRTIDGQRPIRGHGGPDMPVWGDAFARSRDGGDPAKVKQLIESLVDYLESIQARLVH